MSRPAPQVSVVIPTYGRRERVREAIGSVLAQTRRDLELIVVDDGSADGTREAVERIAAADPRVRYHWQPNRGPSAARNTGVAMSRGEIVAFLDSDNLWWPNHLAALTELFALHPGVVAASTCSGFMLTGESDAEPRLIDHRERLVLTGSTLGFISCAAARRAALAAAGGFDERLFVLEDTDLWLRLAALGPFCAARLGTVVRRRDHDSLQGRGRRSGAYLEAAEISAANLVAALERQGSGATARQVEQAAAALRLARALRALPAGPEAVGEELREACRGLPWLSTNPAHLEWRLREHVPGIGAGAERASILAVLAQAWPDPSSTTAHYLRGWAIWAAIRCGRAGFALRLIAGWRPRGTLRLAGYMASRGRRRVARRRKGRRAAPRSIGDAIG